MDRISDRTMTDDQLTRAKSILTSESGNLLRAADRYRLGDETEAARQAELDSDAVECLIAMVVNEQHQRRLDARGLASVIRQYG